MQEVIGRIPEGKRLYIEIKTGAEIVPRQLSIIGFDLEAIRHAKAALPDLR